MGTRAFVTPSQRPVVKNKAGYGHVDLPLLLVLIVLGAFGLIMVFSASWDFSQAVYQSPTRIFFKQVVFMAVGIALAFSLSRFDYHLFRAVAVPIMGVTVVLLLTVLFVNEIRLGAARTLFQGSIQPSELAKVVTILYLAVWLYTKRETLHDINLGLVPLAGILGIIGGLIYLQPDLSATGTIFLLGGLLFFLAGGELRQIVFLIIIALLTGWIVVQFSATGRERLASYLSGLEDPMQSSYHVRRSLEAIVNGGWFGVGIGKAKTKLTGLPVPPTDSIFAVVAEELGLVGALGLVILFGLFIWRGLRIAYKAPDMLGTLLAAGLTIWIGSEALMNMSVMVGLFPFAGNALPFVSAGGSNLIASLAAVGILMNIARQGNGKPQTQANEQERRSFSATIDLRRRNGRRSVSRPGRS
jgi:cell division protein FtsW